MSAALKAQILKLPDPKACEWCGGRMFGWGRVRDGDGFIKILCPICLSKSLYPPIVYAYDELPSPG